MNIYQLTEGERAVNKMRASAAITIVVGGLGMMGATTAQSQESCPSGLVCLYDQANYVGIPLRSNRSKPDISYMANHASSVKNETCHMVTFYSKTGYSGPSFDLDAGRSVKNLRDFGFNDDVESFTVGSIPDKNCPQLPGQGTTPGTPTP